LGYFGIKIAFYCISSTLITLNTLIHTKIGVQNPLSKQLGE
jgi:hypothetical protein